MSEFDISVDLKINVHWITPPDSKQDAMLRDVMQMGVNSKAFALGEDIREKIKEELDKQMI